MIKNLHIANFVQWIPFLMQIVSWLQLNFHGLLPFFLGTLCKLYNIFSGICVYIT